eukprot:1128002-Pelagomonas_calceolata.AAC.3
MSTETMKSIQSPIRVLFLEHRSLTLRSKLAHLVIVNVWGISSQDPGRDAQASPIRCEVGQGHQSMKSGSASEIATNLRWDGCIGPSTIQAVGPDQWCPEGMSFYGTWSSKVARRPINNAVLNIFAQCPSMGWVGLAVFKVLNQPVGPKILEAELNANIGKITCVQAPCSSYAHKSSTPRHSVTK